MVRSHITGNLPIVFANCCFEYACVYKWGTHNATNCSRLDILSRYWL